jgi:hypothetical protein
LQEDFTLTQRLSHCRTPEQILAAYADFWRKAAEDYGEELTTMTELVTRGTRNMVLATPSLTEEKRATVMPRKRRLRACARGGRRLTR